MVDAIVALECNLLTVIGIPPVMLGGPPYCSLERINAADCRALYRLLMGKALRMWCYVWCVQSHAANGGYRRTRGFVGLRARRNRRRLPA